MKDKGIIFAAPMVRALLDWRKTQTRRLCAWPNNPLSPALSYIVPVDDAPGWFGDEEGETCFSTGFKPGQRLYVRETHGFNHYAYERGKVPKPRPADLEDQYISYMATEDDCEIRQELRYRPCIHMPRWASRITLTVEEVRVQRLQDISEADALAEGVVPHETCGFHVPGVDHPNKDFPILARSTAREMYAALWDVIHGSGEWLANPWVTAVTFDVARGNIDAVPA